MDKYFKLWGVVSDGLCLQYPNLRRVTCSNFLFTIQNDGNPPPKVIPLNTTKWRVYRLKKRKAPNIYRLKEATGLRHYQEQSYFYYWWQNYHIILISKDLNPEWSDHWSCFTTWRPVLLTGIKQNAFFVSFFSDFLSYFNLVCYYLIIKYLFKRLFDKNSLWSSIENF